MFCKQSRILKEMSLILSSKQNRLIKCCLLAITKKCYIIEMVDTGSLED